jgi:hypothetical protein
MGWTGAGETDGQGEAVASFNATSGDLSHDQLVAETFSCSGSPKSR